MTTTPKDWLTIAEAATLVGRSKRAVYDWIKAGRLATRINSAGVTEILAKAAVRLEGETKRGRPPGVPNRK